MVELTAFQGWAVIIISITLGFLIGFVVRHETFNGGK